MEVINQMLGLSPRRNLCIWKAFLWENLERTWLFFLFPEVKVQADHRAPNSEKVRLFLGTDQVGRLPNLAPSLQDCAHTQRLTVLLLSLVMSLHGRQMCSMSVCLVTQSHPTLCSPMDCSLPGSSVHGILQARILEWVAMPSSRGSSRPRNWTHISCIADRFFTTESPGKPADVQGSNSSLFTFDIHQLMVDTLCVLSLKFEKGRSKKIHLKYS